MAKKGYKEVWRYLKKGKIFFLVISAIFIIALILGIFYQPAYIESYVKDMLNRILEQIKGKDFFQLLVFIFKNNLFTSFFGLALGLILGIYPLFITLVNGYFIGFVAERAAGVSGIGAIFSLFPHGIFEIPALIISLGLGLKLGFSLIYNFFQFYKKNKYVYFLIPLAFFPFILFLIIFLASLVNKKLRKLFINELKGSLKIFIYVVLPLLIIAAIIETIGIFWI